MHTKDLVLPLVIAGALGVPVFLSSQGEQTPARMPGAATANGLSGNGVLYYPGDAHGPDYSAGPLEFLPLQDWRTVFSFDLSPDAIRASHPRVVPCAGEAGWQGFRTELITGTGPSDLHGCITWSFDARGQLQRIGFRGWTGDASRLKQLLTGQFGLRELPHSGWTETLAKSGWSGTSDAAIFQHPQAARTDLPQQKLAVLLELNRPGRNVGLSETMSVAVASARTE